MSSECLMTLTPTQFPYCVYNYSDSIILILGTLLPLTCDAAGLAEVSVVNADGYRIDDSDITASSEYNEVNCASVMARDLYAADGWETWCSGMTLVSDGDLLHKVLKNDQTYKFFSSDVVLG